MLFTHPMVDHTLSDDGNLLILRAPCCSYSRAASDASGGVPLSSCRRQGIVLSSSSPVQDIPLNCVGPRSECAFVCVPILNFKTKPYTPYKPQTRIPDPMKRIWQEMLDTLRREPGREELLPRPGRFPHIQGP